ncbi:MAG: SGNH/GDSL hydrolase family protein [Candidatus Zixiibacteriota bacterium]|jgi:hypothetical protein
MLKRLALFAAAAALLFLVVSCSEDEEENGGGGTPPHNEKETSVVFVGASITEAWSFSTYFNGYNFHKVVHYDWVKSDAWNEVPPHSPKIVVVKECAAYFDLGGDTPFNEFYAEIRKMVGLIQGINATPVLATTVPVDPGFGGCTQAQLDDIREFNDWIRNYCTAQGFVCLDLAAAIEDGQGQLPRDCHDGDGLHPNEKGYNTLSPIVLPALRDAGL